MDAPDGQDCSGASSTTMNGLRHDNTQLTGFPSSFPPKNDIVEFIQQESLNNKTQSDHMVIETYACTLWKGFFDIKHKLRNIAELDIMYAVDMGIQLIDNLFWIIYHYSSNIQLTLFLTERGRLLYTEFLHMSRTHQLMKELNTFPSIQDGFQFAIKKSIGSLTCQNHSTNMRFQHVSSYRNIYRRMFQIINRKYLTESKETPWTDDQVNLTLHMLNRSMSYAVQRNIEMFEKCMYGTHDISLNLTGFLLLLQLLSDISSWYHHKGDQIQSTATELHKHEHETGQSTIPTIRINNWDERVIRPIVHFIHQNSSYVQDNTLECLQNGHILQHKWSVCREQLSKDIDICAEDVGNVEEIQSPTYSCSMGGSMSDSVGSISSLVSDTID